MIRPSRHRRSAAPCWLAFVALTSCVGEVDGPVDRTASDSASPAEPDATDCVGTACVTQAAAARAAASLDADRSQPEPVIVCRDIDFDLDDFGSPVLAGSFVWDQWGFSGLLIECQNRNPDHPDECLIFDSSAPTGGDRDLGTPHCDFDGPGRGDGGAAGSPWVNDTPLHNLLILAENDDDADGDGLVDDPDDEAAGGIITMFFFPPAFVESIQLIDIDADEPDGAIITCSCDDQQDVEIPIPPTGDNGVQTVPVNQPEVYYLDIDLASSGGVGQVSYCAPCSPLTCENFLHACDGVPVDGCGNVLDCGCE